MVETDNLRLPYLMAAQAQKHVTHNEALRSLDAIVQLAVEDRDLTAPPVAPADGARYLIASPAAGDWTGHDGEIAAYQDAAWMFHAPREGWMAWVSDEDTALVYDGSGWATLSAGGGSGSVNPTPLVGINATADTTNRLSLASPASLFNHAGAGHQLKVNKAAVADTSSLLYQTAFSGRAEMGLTGDDDFHFKVSADGTIWNEAIVIDKSSGAVAFPNTIIGGGGGGSGINANLLINGGFQINQRAFAGGALSAGSYGFDRWKAATGGANLSISGFVVTLASGEIEQIVETSVWGSASFASQAVTVSVEAPSQQLTVTFGSQSGTIAAGAGRQSVTLNLGAGDTGNLSFKLKRTAAGSVTFGRVKLELGGTATAWEARAAPLEFSLCQRYFVRFSANGGRFGNGIAALTTDARILLTGLVLRTTPSVAFLNCNVIRTAMAAVSSMSVIAYSSGVVHLQCIASGLTAGEPYQLHQDQTGSVFTDLDAEL
ncbi:MAG: DUF2793 domain-containing protein [Alphaproteobacteria bacterium]|nr:DUF2793 domain-containing protein [Alphaproteobacteria bacterium]